MIESSDWRRAILAPESLVHEAISTINNTGLGIALVSNSDEVLLGTITDGDIRRGLLKGLGTSSAVTEIMNRQPIVVPQWFHRSDVVQVMNENQLRQIPVVNAGGRLSGLYTLNEFNAPRSRDNIMIIMAGGMGRRLYPQTANCPKPLLPIGGKPILEHIIRRASSQGFSNFTIAVHHLGNMIENYFGTGESLGVRIEYLREESPLGTAGALSLLSSIPKQPLIVTNGDVLTDINYGELIDFHVQNSAVATMAVRRHEMQNPFGVVNIEDYLISGYEEKPIITSYINAGVYVFDHSVPRLFKNPEKLDMSQLFQKLLIDSRKIIAYPVHEGWLDVGHPQDFLKAKNLYE